MRRSRRLSGLQPDPVVDIINNPPAKKRAASKKKTTNKSSSKKENRPPSRSARKPKQEKPTRTKRAVSTRKGSKKQKTPKKKATPKRGPAVAASARQPPAKAKKAKPASKSAKRPRPQVDDDVEPEDPKQVNKGTVDIHPRPSQQTPPPRRDLPDHTDDDKYDDEDPSRDRIQEPEQPIPPAPRTSPPPTQTDDLAKTPKKLDLEGLSTMMVGIVVSLITLYGISFCRATSCQPLANISWVAPEMLEFNQGAIVLTSFVLYIVSLAYCRNWFESDGFMPADEGAYATLNGVHGFLVCCHLICCAVMNSNEKSKECMDSVVALSAGFSFAALGMQLQLKPSYYMARNLIACGHLIVLWHLEKNAFGAVLLMALKSLFWMVGVLNKQIGEKDQLMDVIVTFLCGLVAYLW